MCSTCGCKGAEGFEAPMTRYDEYCISCGDDCGANSNLCMKCQKMFGVKKASNRMIARLGLGAESFEADVYVIESGSKTEMSFQELFDHLNSAIDDDYFLTKKERDDYFDKFYSYDAESFDEDDDDWRDWGEGMTIPQMAKALSKMSWDEVDEETGYGDDLFDWFNKWDKKSQKERETYALRVLKESYEAESFEAQRKLTDIDRDGKPYTGQIYPDHPDLDPSKADRNKDGYMSSWERALGNQVARGMEKYKSERKKPMKRMKMMTSSKKSTSVLPSVIVVGLIAAVVGSKIRK